MKQEEWTFFERQEKAMHHALWMNFQHRATDKHFGVIHGPEDNFAVVEDAFRKEMQTDFLEIPKEYANLSYQSIEEIRLDDDPLAHLEELCGMFSTLSGEILRFILHTQLPLEKFIRFELACRGYDPNMHWVGFEKAKEVWLE